MTREKILKLTQTLIEFKKIEHTKLSYAVMKNLRILGDELKKITNRPRPTEKLKEWDKKRLELCKQYAKKDDNGDPIIIDNFYDIEDREAFDKANNELKEQYKVDIEEAEAQSKKYQEELQQDVKIKLYYIKSNDLPDNLTVEQLEKLEDIIIEC